MSKDKWWEAYAVRGVAQWLWQRPFSGAGCMDVRERDVAWRNREAIERPKETFYQAFWAELNRLLKLQLNVGANLALETEDFPPWIVREAALAAAQEVIETYGEETDATKTA